MLVHQRLDQNAVVVMRVGLGRDGGGTGATLLMLLLLSVRGVYAGGGTSGRFPPSSSVVWDCGCDGGNEAVLLCELALLLLLLLVLEGVLLQLLPMVLDVPGLALPALAAVVVVVEIEGATA